MTLSIVVLAGGWHRGASVDNRYNAVVAERAVETEREAGDARPLEPRSTLRLCAMSMETYEQVSRVSPRRFVHMVNGWSALQSDKYVFSRQRTAPSWLQKRLNRRATDEETTPPVLTEWFAL